MKLADRTVEVHSVGINSTNQFTIAQSSKMFKILSDSLYSDKIMAVIRELSTNAYDSHVSAGNQNPFVVKLPTAADPNFSVRDYGTGLSREDMESLYTTYGASNKNDSNDFVGCLGLGSKSPFAYTKSFTTTSYFNGMQYTYIAAIDDAGVPNLNLIHSCETNEPNGLEIGFAVKTYDFREFSRTAVRVFHYFKQRPIIRGGVDYDFTNFSNRNIIISGEGWRVCRLNNDSLTFPNYAHRIHSGIIAIMGNIAYPVESSNLTGSEEKETPDHIARWNRAFNKADIASWKSFVNEIINQGLYLELEFGIGELEMDVSREGLQYTKQVVKNLREKTQSIYLELKSEFSKKIQESKTKVEAIQTYYELNDLAGGWGVGASWTDSNGKSHDIGSGVDLEYKLDSDKNLYAFNYRTAGYRSRRLVYLTNMIHHETLNGRGSYYWNSNKKSNRIKFFWCDVASQESAKKIVTKYCNQNDCFAYLMVDTKDHNNVKQGFDSLVADVGAENILNVSDYKDLIKSAPSKRTSKGTKGSVSDQDVFLITNHTSDNQSLNYDYNDAALLKTLSEDQIKNFNDQDQIIYVPMVRYASTETGILHISHFFKNARISGLKKVKVYAIKTSYVQTLKKMGLNLVLFREWFDPFISKILKDKYSVVLGLREIMSQAQKEIDWTPKDKSRYSSKPNIPYQFACHMLSIFGLDYAQYIKNDSMVKCIEDVLVLHYFSDCHRDRINLGYNHISENDYKSHIQSIFDKRNTTIDVSTLSENIANFSNIESSIRDIGYEINASDKIKVSLPVMSKLEKIVKEQVDNNPMLKYIVGSSEFDSLLWNTKENTNIVTRINGSDGGYWNTSSNPWFDKMSDEQAQLFRVQLSSLIK